MRVFYEPTEFECLKPIVDNKDTIVEELNACRNEDMFFNFVADFKGDDVVENVVGSWIAAQIYYRKSGSHKIHAPNHANRRKVKKKWIKYLRLAPQLFPETHKILESVDQVYWSGMSKIQANSEIKPHRHKYRVPTLTFQICLTPPTGTCTLTANGESIKWNEMGQMNIFDGRYEHDLINDSPDSRTIMHMEIDPTSHPDWRDEIEC